MQSGERNEVVKVEREVPETMNLKRINGRRRLVLGFCRKRGCG
jgi:hypothetical protein